MRPSRLLGALLALAACRAEKATTEGATDGGPGGTAGNAGGAGTGDPAGTGGSWHTSNKLDLLFVVDNSSSTFHFQLNFACNFSRFVEALEALPLGTPDLHLAIVTPDLGSGALRIPSCGRSGGDDGAMQSAPHPLMVDCSANGAAPLDTTGCTGPQEGKGWIRFKSATDNNLGGQDLARAVACIAPLGDHGCGFESVLGATVRALERASDPNDPVNAGFLRADALLAIVILTDEDDCSLPADSLLGDTSSGTDVGSTLGPLTSFRCTEYGVICDGFQRDPANPAALRRPGPMGGYRNCRPNDDGLGVPEPRHRLRSVREMVARIQALKPPSATIVEVIGGPAPPEGAFDVEVGTAGGAPVPVLALSCQGGAGPANPGVRLQAFLEAWHPTRRILPICQQSLADVLAGIARRLAGS